MRYTGDGLWFSKIFDSSIFEHGVGGSMCFPKHTIDRHEHFIPLNSILQRTELIGSAPTPFPCNFIHPACHALQFHAVVSFNLSIGSRVSAPPRPWADQQQ